MKWLSLTVFIFLSAIAQQACMKISDPLPVVNPTERNIFASKEHLGVNYEPYHYDGQHPGVTIPVSQIQADLAVIAQTFKYLRTYSVEDNMDQVVPVAHGLNLQVALGVYCHPGDSVRTKHNIDKAVSMAALYPETVACLVIGNEMNIKNDTNYVPATVVMEYMIYTKSRFIALGLNITITSCITGGGADPDYNDPSQEFCGVIMQACRDLNEVNKRVILLTIYPYWGQYYTGKSTPENILSDMTWSYQHGMKQARVMYDVCTIIGEIGWPSASYGIATERENKTNMGLNFNATLNWLSGSNEQYQAFNGFWYMMFDEPWKTHEQNEVGPYWGIYEKNGSPTPKFSIPVIR